MVQEMKYVYGPVPSRRLGISLGISPIPPKVCNYSCIYCQLGRTDRMTNRRQMFFPLQKIVQEFSEFLENDIKYDVVTIVGEGEPTLYQGMGQLVSEIHEITNKPVAVITNGALMSDPKVREELSKADIVLPSMDAYDETSFRRICRPHGSLRFADVIQGLKEFSRIYQGQLWLEIMLMKDINDDDVSIARYATILKTIKYDKLYLNTPVRPPAEPGISVVEHDRLDYAAKVLGGISIDLLASSGFHSEIKDDYNAIISIIRRHPMNQFETEGFLKARGCCDIDNVISRLKGDSKILTIDYKGYETYRLR